VKRDRLLFLSSVLISLPLVLSLVLWLVWFFTHIDILFFPVLFVFYFLFPKFGFLYIALSFGLTFFSWNKKLTTVDKTILVVNFSTSVFFVALFLWTVLNHNRM
jgi:hypothetical protein